MKRIVLVFGLISGAITSIMMFLTMPLIQRGTVNFDNGEVVGYTSILLSFLVLFPAIRSYRENVGGGTITFGRAFSVGILITVISCLFYVASWQVISHTMWPNFADNYAAHVTAKARARGASAEEMAKTQKEMQDMKKMLADPVKSAAMIFLEPFPVGLIVTLVASGILRKRDDAIGSPLPERVA